MQCPHFAKCGAAYCPAAGGRHLANEPTCRLLRLAVKNGPETHFGADIPLLLAARVLGVAGQLLTARSSLGRELRRAAGHGSQRAQAKRLTRPELAAGHVAPRLTATVRPCSASRWHWVRAADGTTRFRDVAIDQHGALTNPRGYPEQEVREAIAAAQAQKSARRKAGAVKAAQTRARRRALKVDLVARQIVAGRIFGPAARCACCRKGLGDPVSIKRGIGSECWDGILTLIERNQSSKLQTGSRLTDFPRT